MWMSKHGRYLVRAPVKNLDVHVVSAGDEENKVLIRVQTEQRKDGELSQIINYLEGKSLPEVGLRRLCRHNFRHNRHAKALSIMPAY